MNAWRGWLVASVLLGAGAGHSPGQEKSGDLVVLDQAGKEVIFKNWKLTGGIRKLPWAQETKMDPKTKKSVTVLTGPEYLEFRENSSTTFASGIVTFVPTDSVKKLDYDHKAKEISLTVQAAKGDLTLKGFGKFLNLNKFNFEGDAGGAVQVGGPAKIQDGHVLLGVQTVRFPAGKAVPEPTGPRYQLLATDKEKSPHAVHGLSALYKVGAGQRTSNVLMFQKVGQVDLAKIKSLKHLPAKDKKSAANEWEVVMKEGEKQVLVLLEKTNLEENQPAVLVGLYGQAAAGYKLLPTHTFSELRLEEETK